MLWGPIDNQLRDRVVAGISHAELQKKLLLTKDLNFQLARQTCEQHDDVSAATTTTAQCLLAGDRGKKYVSSSSRNREHRQSKSYNQEQKRSDIVSSSTPIGKYFFCGDNRSRNTCRFRHTVCHACGKAGHLKAVCQGSKHKSTLLTAEGKVLEERNKLVLATVSDELSTTAELTHLF